MEEQYDKIERYLSGELSGEERAAFEASLTADAALRREVALHRSLAVTFADPGELALRGMLEEIAEESAPHEAVVKRMPRRNRSWLWPTLGLVAVALGFYLFLPAILGDGPTTPAFNPELEALMERGNDPVFDFELSAETTAVGEEDRLRIAGILQTVELPETGTFVVRVYDADPENFPATPLFSAEVRPVEDTSEPSMGFGGKKVFDLAVEAPLPAAEGTYYYVVTDETGQEVLFVGKVKDRE